MQVNCQKTSGKQHFFVIFSIFLPVGESDALTKQIIFAAAIRVPKTVVVLGVFCNVITQ